MFLTFNINMTFSQLIHNERYILVSVLLPFCVTVQADKCTESKFSVDTSKAIRRQATLSSKCRPPETKTSTLRHQMETFNSNKGNFDELHCSDPVICENSGTDSIIIGHWQRGEFNL